MNGPGGWDQLTLQLLSGFLGALLALVGTYGFTIRAERRKRRAIATAMAREVVDVASDAGSFGVVLEAGVNQPPELRESNMSLFLANADLFRAATTRAILDVERFRRDLILAVQRRGEQASSLRNQIEKEEAELTASWAGSARDLKATLLQLSRKTATDMEAVWRRTLLRKVHDLVSACRNARRHLEQEGASHFEETGFLTTPAGASLFPPKSVKAKFESPVEQWLPFIATHWAPLGKAWHWLAKRLRIPERFR